MYVCVCVRAELLSSGWRSKLILCHSYWFNDALEDFCLFFFKEIVNKIWHEYDLKNYGLRALSRLFAFRTQDKWRCCGTLSCESKSISVELTSTMRSASKNSLVRYWGVNLNDLVSRFCFQFQIDAFEGPIDGIQLEDGHCGMSSEMFSKENKKMLLSQLLLSHPPSLLLLPHWISLPFAL